MKNLYFKTLFYMGITITNYSVAGEIGSLIVSPQIANTGQLIELSIDIKKKENLSINSQVSSTILGADATSKSDVQANLPCAVLVNYGDGQTQHIRVDADNPILKTSHTYSNSGNFSVSVEGKILIDGLKSVFSCSGNRQVTTLTVQQVNVAQQNSNLSPQKNANNAVITDEIITSGLPSEELLKRGIAAYDLKKYEDANTLLTAYVKVKPRQAIANLYLGLTLKELNEKEIALKTLKSSLKMKLNARNRQLAKQAIYSLENDSPIKITDAENSITPVFILDKPQKNDSSEKLNIINASPQHLSFNQLTSLIKGSNQDYRLSKALIIDFLPPLIYETESFVGTKKIKKASGTSEEANPAWESANKRMLEAQNQTKKSVKENEEMQSKLQQSAQALDDKGITSLFVTAIGLIPVYTSNNDYMDAVKNFESTPKTISKTIYTDFTYPLIDKAIKRVDKATAYLVDFNKSTVTVKDFNQIESGSIILDHGSNNLESASKDSEKQKQAITKIEYLKDISKPLISVDMVVKEALNNFTPKNPKLKLINLPEKISKQHANTFLENKKIAEQNAQNTAKLEKAISKLNKESPVKDHSQKIESVVENKEINKTSDTKNQKPFESSSGKCIENFEYLASKYPNFDDTELQKGKASLTLQTVKEIIYSAKSQGLSVDETIDNSILQANEFKRAYKEALTCASSVDAYGNDEEDFIETIKKDKNIVSGGIRNSCLAAAIAYHMGYMHAKSLTSALICNKRRGTY